MIYSMIKRLTVYCNIGILCRYVLFLLTDCFHDPYGLERTLFGNCTNNVTRRHHKLNKSFWTSIFQIKPFTVTQVKFRKIANMDPKQTRKARSFLRQGLFPFQKWRLRGHLPFTVEKIHFTSIILQFLHLHYLRSTSSNSPTWKLFSRF